MSLYCKKHIFEDKGKKKHLQPGDELAVKNLTLNINCVKSKCQVEQNPFGLAPFTTESTPLG